MTVNTAFKFVKTIAALALLTIAPGCEMLGFREWTWHQKLNVSVTTPAGVKSDHSVFRVWVEFTPKWWGLGDAAGAANSSWRGEAVVVDVGAGRYLFALIKGYEPSIAAKIFFPEEMRNLRRVEDLDSVYDKVSSLRATKSVPKEFYPILLTFDDVRNPLTVRRVDPDNLATTFGKGFSLSDISLTITDEPVTMGKISTVLDWLDEYYGKYLDGSDIESLSAVDRLANSLGSDSFNTEK
ncbi:hypothetical protein IB237_15375 [Agrobacterium sp. AGB01]|uniref:hypothetical protein n=1 Tax=Agrobacterium sp. AGB01 TaxID=2769302 RepID=UPI00177B6DB5|nr:hypothetical protein [Agrobacterium sp. AGB01]MBD9388563.1 hypothetical protein [Agrobacterium sp. AGB01]